MTATMTDTIRVTSWYMQCTDHGHYKQYSIFAGSDGRLILRWGRIGTAGQSKFEQFPDFEGAEQVAKRQFFSKLAKGYQAVDEEFAFEVDTIVWEQAFVWNNASTVETVRDRAKREGLVANDAAVKHFDAFTARATELLGRANDAPLEDVMDAWQQLKQAWEVIEDRHSLAQVTVALTEQAINTRVMGV